MKIAKSNVVKHLLIILRKEIDFMIFSCNYNNIQSKEEEESAMIVKVNRNSGS